MSSMCETARSVGRAFIWGAVLVGGCIASRARAQPAFTGTATYDFTSYAGAGFALSPSVGQLSTDAFRARRSSVLDTCPYLSASCVGPFAQGVATTGVGGSGFFAFDVGGGNRIFGVMPRTTQTDAGMRFRNATGAPITHLRVRYDGWWQNDDSSYSTCTVRLIRASGARTTLAAHASLGAGAPPGWNVRRLARQVDLLASPIAVGEVFELELRFTRDSGLRADSIGVDAFVIQSGVGPLCGDGVVSAGEACDDGLSLGTIPCGCALDCTYPTSMTPCGAAALGGCDLDDACDGVGACAARVRPAGTECRAATGVCDVAEACDGTSGSCPPDARATPGTVCRPAAGPCDVDEVCDGTTVLCPTDSLAGAGTTCRSAAGPCDAPEVCSGSASVCPPDASRPDGVVCGDALVCNGDERCAAGACVTTPLVCDDMNACTDDSCAEPGGCGYAGRPGCCNVDTDCDDGDACTADSCSGPGGVCAASPITGCCRSDAGCDDGNDCTRDTCDLGSNRCATGPVAGCCATDADCDDANACTADTCDAASGACRNSATMGCCLADGDCDDADTCTADRCVANACVRSPRAGCCAIDGDCDDGDPCTSDRCLATTASCSSQSVPGCASDPDGGVSDPDGGTVADAGQTGPDGGAPTGPDGGCACRAIPRSTGPGAPIGLLALAGLVVGRRRRRRG